MKLVPNNDSQRASSSKRWTPRPSSDHRYPVNDGEMTAEGWCFFNLPSAVRARFSREPLVSDCLINDAGYFPRSRGHRAWRPEGVREAIFIVCLAGQGWAADLRRKRAARLPVWAHEVLVIPPGAPHFYAADKRHPWSVLWFHFSGPRAALFLKQLGASEGMVKGLVRNPALFAEPIRKMFDLRRRGLTRSVLLECNALGEVVLARLCAEACLAPLGEAGLSGPKAGSAQDAEKLHRVTAFLETNYRGNLQVTDVARSCLVSESWLFHEFAAHTGFTPLGFLTHLRLQEASRLLLETPRKLADIAAEVGYGDPFYFSRLFKKHMGQSPDSYRREYRR